MKASQEIAKLNMQTSLNDAQNKHIKAAGESFKKAGTRRDEADILVARGGSRKNSFSSSSSTMTEQQIKASNELAKLNKQQSLNDAQNKIVKGAGDSFKKAATRRDEMLVARGGSRKNSFSSSAMTEQQMKASQEIAKLNMQTSLNDAQNKIVIAAGDSFKKAATRRDEADMLVARDVDSSLTS